MNFNYRVKVLGKSAEELLAMGFALNTFECRSGEYWLIGTSEESLRQKVVQNGLRAVSEYMAMR